MPTYTLGEIQRLHRLHGRLEKQYDELFKKVEYLDSVRTKKSDPLAIYELTQQIEADEAELAKIEAKLCEVEQALESARKPSPGEILQKALCQLNYHEQMNVFQEAIDQSWVLAFLMHGKREYGHRWLLYRFEKKLLSNQDKRCEIVKIRFDLSSQLFERTPDGFWRKLGHEVGLLNSQSMQEIDKAEIAKRVGEQLKSKSVILIFDNLDMDSNGMEQLMQKFWQPLIEKIQSRRGQSTSNYLLMFLVDERGCVHEWRFRCVDKVGEGWKAGDPIRLAELSELTHEVVTDWIMREGQKWPDLFDQGKPRVREIMEYSKNGIPRGVFERICILCGGHWNEEERGFIVYDQQFA